MHSRASYIALYIYCVGQVDPSPPGSRYPQPPLTALGEALLIRTFRPSEPYLKLEPAFVPATTKLSISTNRMSYLFFSSVQGTGIDHLIGCACLLSPDFPYAPAGKSE